MGPVARSYLFLGRHNLVSTTEAGKKDSVEVCSGNLRDMLPLGKLELLFLGLPAATGNLRDSFRSSFLALNHG